MPFEKFRRVCEETDYSQHNQDRQCDNRFFRQTANLPHVTVVGLAGQSLRKTEAKEEAGSESGKHSHRCRPYAPRGLGGSQEAFKLIEG